MAEAAPKHSPVEMLHPRSLKYLSGHLQVLVRGRLWLQVIIGMVLGLTIGILIGPSVGWVSLQTASVTSSWLALPGHLFLALIQMIVIPLIFASIIRGLAATEDLEQLRKIGLRVGLYFIVTTALAIVIGLAVALLLKPGQFVDSQAVQAALGAAPPAMTNTTAPPDLSLSKLPKQVLTLLPTNPLSSMVEADMLRIVVFAMVVGVALVMMAPRQARPLLDLLGSLQEVCMTVVRWAMILAPLAVFGLTAQLTAKIGLEALLGMAAYVGTVLTGLLLLFAVYLAILYLAARQSPLYFLRSTRELLLLAFSTSSSAAVMPLSIKTSEEKLRVRPSISQFVIPLGATVNMNGTALYQGVAAIFLAQVFGIEIGVGGMLLIVITAVGSSIGAPAAPGVGMVILAMVLGTVGIPPAGIALVMGVDRILDMCRTVINVSGDVVAAVLMDRWVGSSKSKSAERQAEAEREKLREASGADVIITDHRKP
ncbi:MAG: dicarboxylate/amino acid:cation symporter [Rhodospirillales bacterium]